MKIGLRSRRNEKTIQDISGFTIFSTGESGAAHSMAHEMLDTDRPELGHRLLGEWLDGRSGSGSDWLHLQFHMGVFELAVGKWEAAYDRFRREILPGAATTEDALTDAPALLWRISLSAPASVELPWEPLRQTALNCLTASEDPFVTLHHLLAFAGAGDAGSIEGWLGLRRSGLAPRSECLLRQMARALHACATGAYRQAAARLQSLVPQLSQIGGSRAQNELFRQLQQWCSQQSSDADFEAVRLMAA